MFRMSRPSVQVASARRMVVGLALCAALFLQLNSPLIQPVDAVSIPAVGTPVTQDFDTLAASGPAWTDDVTLAGWYSTRTAYTAGTGSSGTGALYSFGVAGTNPVTDRALGSVGSGGTGTIYWAVKLENATGVTINSLTVNYTGEQWRNGGSVGAGSVAQTLDFQYQVAAAGAITDADTPSTGWVDYDSLDFTSPTFGGTSPVTLDGNAAANRTVKSASFTVPNVAAGQEIWLRWRDINHPDNDHALAVDDFSVTATGGPFSTDGIQITDIEAVAAATSTDDAAYAVAVQSDGKIVVGGYAVDPVSGDREFAVARYNENGTLDTTFDTDGIVTTDFSGGNDRVWGIVIQPLDGKIVVGGTAATDSGNTDTRLAVARYDTDGSLDGSLAVGGAGPVVKDEGFAVALESDGKIIVVGKQTDSGVSKPYVVEFTAALGFSAAATFTPTAGNSEARSVAINADGIYVAGYGDDGVGKPDFLLMRLTSALLLDTGFDTDGIVTTDFFGETDQAYDVAIQSDDKVVVVGLTGNTGNGTKDFAVARYTTAGALDSSFDTDGKQTADFAGSPDVALSVAIQSDGKIVAAGFTVAGSENFAIARYHTGGSLDTGFSGDGKQVTPVSTSNDRANAVAMQSDGKIVAAGFSTIPASSPVNRDFAVVRYLTDGSLDGETGGPPILPVNLVLTKSNPGNTVVGNDMTYTLTVVNNGPGDATNVVLTDLLPASVLYVSETHTHGTVSGTTTVTNTIGSLFVGQTATLTITANTTEAKLVINTANVTSDQAETNSSNNSASVTTRVIRVSALSFSPNVVLGDCGSSTGTVTLSGNAPGGGVNVTLASDDASATPDTPVFIAAGTNSMTFTVATSSVVVSTTPTITATLGTSSVSKKLRVNPCFLE